MKILAICLLRSGDFILQAEALMQRYLETGDSIHVLINKSSVPLLRLYPWIERYYVFHREGVQAAIKEERFPLIFADHHIYALKTAVKSENYDLIVNLSHNRVSGRWLEVFAPRNHIGLGSTNGVFGVGAHDPWGQLMNDPKRSGDIHFLDIYKGMCGVTHSNVKQRVHSKSDTYFCVQMLTSDEKKNWGLQSWVKLIGELTASLQMRAVIVVADFEFDAISQAIARHSQQNIEIAVANWIEAKEILSAAQFLLTGDTSIKHLASMVGCPSIELCLGSSNYRETGAYAPGSIIIESLAGCHPCKHSGNCHQPSYYCRETIPVVAVKEIVENRYLGRPVDTLALSRVRVLETEIDKFGFWKTKKYVFNHRSKESQDERESPASAP